MKFLNKLMLFLALVPTFPSLAMAEELRIGATPVPHAEILESIKPALAKQGVTLDIKVFTDYVQPNLQVAQKKLDANFFQHRPYLDEFNNRRGTALVNVAGVHIEPFGAYSKKVKKLDDLAEGATVALPNNATNGGRALLLLAAHKAIQLREAAGITATVRDIVSNPKKL
ncbi:MAG: methionine ABC transporter substrate-binding protein, partial [Azoarcus sp.]|nr:methionine ABC transporter substrate-binding protein [Azoarcus sp.]